MPDLFESSDSRDPVSQITQEPTALVPDSLSVPRPELAADPHEASTIRDVRAHPVVRFEQVSKWYGPVIGVNQVTLRLFPGITGLVGRNGAGKSTLMRLAAGQVWPDLGQVLVGNEVAASYAGKLHIGYCPDHDRFYEDMSGREFVRVMAGLTGYSSREAKSRTESALDIVGMVDRADRRISGYSKGMRQRIKLAQALIHDPEFLLLDEPLSGIDPVGRRSLIEVFRKLSGMGKCLLISSHELEELEKLTNHVAIMAHGRIAAIGTQQRIRELLANHPLSIKIRSDDNQKLGMSLLGLEEVVTVDLENEEQLLIRVRDSKSFFEKFSHVVLDENFDIEHLETLDDTTHSILEYLLG
ncbi:MAG: ABC transporter ATP-binding protein [Gemmataceae bacterium]